MDDKKESFSELQQQEISNQEDKIFDSAMSVSLDSFGLPSCEFCPSPNCGECDGPL